MSKPKLTQNQKRRIQSNNNKVLHRHQKKEIEWRDDMLGESQEGLVVTRYARHADVEMRRGRFFGVTCVAHYPALWWGIMSSGVKAMSNCKA